MRVHLCGVRGSTPAPGPEFMVGGHTSCVAISHGDEAPSLVLDAGTGLRVLTGVMAGAPLRGTIVLTHCHWDHIMGLPFFAAGDHPDAEVRLLVPEQGEDAKTVLSRAMSPPLFPITPDQLRGKWCFETYDEGVVDIDGFEVIAREVPHKGGRTMGLRVADESGAIGYLPDHSPHDLGPGPTGVGELHDGACELARDVDVLLHDAQYTRDELPARATWGHAAADYSVELAEHCGARRVMLFHHDPSRTDAALETLHAAIDRTTGLPVDVARQGMTIDL